MEPSAPLKRFYKAVSVEKSDNGFFVTLDGRKLKSPAKRDFILPTQALADAIAAEWEAQEEHIQPLTMPMMALASTAVDRIGQLRAGVIEQIVKYAETDLICYWTDDPEDLAKRQSKAWTPYLEWAQKTYGAEFKTQTGILHIKQPDASIKAIAEAVNSYDDWTLSALSSATHCTGSIILGLALVSRHIDAQQAFDDSQVDETYQIELWGEDWEAKDRRDALMRDLNSVVDWLNLL